MTSVFSKSVVHFLIKVLQLAHAHDVLRSQDFHNYEEDIFFFFLYFIS